MLKKEMSQKSEYQEVVNKIIHTTAKEESAISHRNCDRGTNKGTEAVN
jgi:hypothetical protein